MLRVRVHFQTQTPSEDLQGKEAERTQQLRSDVTAFFRGSGGISGRWLFLLVLFPGAGKPRTATQPFARPAVACLLCETLCLAAWSGYCAAGFRRLPSCQPWHIHSKVPNKAAGCSTIQ